MLSILYLHRKQKKNWDRKKIWLAFFLDKKKKQNKTKNYRMIIVSWSVLLFCWKSFVCLFDSFKNIIISNIMMWMLLLLLFPNYILELTNRKNTSKKYNIDQWSKNKMDRVFLVFVLLHLNRLTTDHHQQTINNNKNSLSLIWFSHHSFIHS